MRRLHTKVNLIPVIAKADTLTDEEVHAFKQRVSGSINLLSSAILEIDTSLSQILSDIAHHNIHIFQAPAYENEDEEVIAENEEIAVIIALFSFGYPYSQSIQSKVPFAIVGSDREVQTPDGRIVRGRVYPWGVVEVDNEDHCDFVKLRQMLVRTFMEELREHTHGVLYENWRTEKLLSMGIVQDANVFKEVK
jgi:septin 7